MIQRGALRQLTHSRPTRVNSFITLGTVFSLLTCFPSVLESSQPTRAEWIREVDGHALVWGVKGGIVLGVHRFRDVERLRAHALAIHKNAEAA